MRSFLQAEALRPQRHTRAAHEPTIYGAAFACASLAFCLHSLAATRLGPAASLCAIVGSVTCGWAWLATRSLFRPACERDVVWPLGAVVCMMAVSAAPLFAPFADTPLRILANTAHLASSAMLLLAVAEPMRGLPSVGAPAERRFRIIYAAGYLAIVLIAVLAVNGAPAGSLAARFAVNIKVTCAIAAVGGFAIALAYRAHHPLEQPPLRAQRRPLATDPQLGARLTELLVGRRMFAQADLRVADLSGLTGEPEYKVTQCITGTLGFRNFSQMVNGYRIAEAKRRLADPALAHLPILTIALDCGFGSIGPFNRAFKADTGVTPLAFRRG